MDEDVPINPSTDRILDPDFDDDGLELYEDDYDLPDDEA